MSNFKRVLVQVHDIEADSPAQADEIARIRADAVNAGMRVLGHGTAWAVKVLDADSEDGGLTDILQDAYLLDEIDDDPERNPHVGYRALDETVVFEELLAWRDAAVRAALDAERTAVADWEWGTNEGGFVSSAGDSERLARKWLAMMPGSTLVRRRRASRWETVAAEESR